MRSDQGLGENVGLPVRWYALDISIQLLTVTHIDYGAMHTGIVDSTYKGRSKSPHVAELESPG